MNHVQSKKIGLHGLLETEAIGRASRKLTWILMKIFAKLSGKFHEMHIRLPYVKKVTSQLTDRRVLLLNKYYSHLSNLLTDLPFQPKISVLIPVYKVDPHYFDECLGSVAQQVYKNWELCIVDDCSNDPRINEVVTKYQKAFPGQIHFATNEQNSHISITSNNCLKLATGEYIALLDHDDRFYPNSLGEMVRQINYHAQPDILYSDERTIDEAGNKRHDPYRKPSWSPFMHLCMNYTTHLSVYNTGLIRKIGGFRKGFEGSQDHDLMLRAVEGSDKPVVHVPFCLYQWRAHPLSTAASVSSKPYAAIAGEKAVSEALERRGRKADVTYEPLTHHYRLKFQLPTPLPLVSIVIPSKNALQYIQPCIDSIFSKSTYKNIEVIVVDNGSTAPEVLDFYRSASAKHGNFRVVDHPHYFNFGKMINTGARKAKGSYILALNNDTAVIEPSWIEEMLQLAQFEEIGAVGCKLLFQDTTIQHAGILLTGPRLAEHAGIQLPDDHTLYCNVLNTIHEVSAVTAACMLVSKEKYDRVGGFDENFSPNGYGDVEFCLRLNRTGLTNIYTPYARLFHYESPTRGASIEYFERFNLMTRYGDLIMNDPYLNPNLCRGPRFDIDFGQEQLDLNAQEFDYFLKTPQKDWGKFDHVKSYRIEKS